MGTEQLRNGTQIGFGISWFLSLHLHLVPLPLHSSGSGNITKQATQINITVFQHALQNANIKGKRNNYTSHFLVPTSKLHLLHVITTQILNPVCPSLNLCWSQQYPLSYLENRNHFANIAKTNFGPFSYNATFRGHTKRCHQCFLLFYFSRVISEFKKKHKLQTPHFLWFIYNRKWNKRKRKKKW